MAVDSMKCGAHKAGIVPETGVMIINFLRIPLCFSFLSTSLSPVQSHLRCTHLI